MNDRLPLLYNADNSGNCYKVRLLCALLGVRYETIAIGKVPGSPISANDVSPEFLRMNPRGQIPLMEIDGHAIWDSTAILIYLARRHGDERWLPLSPAVMARVAQWLALAQNDLLFGLARARSIIQGRQNADLNDALRHARRALATLQNGLEGREWLAADHPTIADIACYPYVPLVAEAGLTLNDYAALPAWIERIRALPGYVDMSVATDTGPPNLES